MAFIKTKLSFLQSINTDCKEWKQQQYGTIRIKAAAQVLWHLLKLNLYGPYITL